MLGLDRNAARITWTVFVIALVILLAYMARHTIIVFLVALFFAYILYPAVNTLERLVPARISRTWALVVVYLVFVGALIGIGSAIGSTVMEQAANLSAKLPELIKSKDGLQGLPLPGWLDPLRTRIIEAIRSQLGSLDKSAIPLLKAAAEQLFYHAGTALEVVLVPILSFFFLKDGARMREAIVDSATDGRNTLLLDKILDDVHLLLGHYIRALVFLALATFLSYSVFLEATGGQYAVLLGGAAGLLEFIPVVGPLVAALVIFAVEAFSGYGHIPAAIVFILCYRMFQDYVLSPYLMGSGVELHPLLVLFGVFAGEQIAGIPGMFFSVPLLAVLRVVYVRAMRARSMREVTPTSGLHT